MKRSLVAFSAVAASYAAFATPHVTQTSMVQDSKTRRVTISYVLDEPAVVTLDVQTNRGDGVFCSIGREPLRHVSGDINCLVKTVGAPVEINWQPDLYWQLGKRLPDGSVKAVVTAWATNAPPDYMVFDLNGVDCVRYYESEAELPYPITNDCYKTDYLVMRKVHAADRIWCMGSPANEQGRSTHWSANIEKQHMVTLTKDYYFGVYELTIGQLNKVSSKNYGSADKRCPAGSLNYDAIRGSTGKGIDWPTTVHAVDSGSIIQALRNKMGVEVDLPTSAQWEFACRADTLSAFYTGTNTMTAEEYTKIAWYKDNCTAAQPVGLKAPNAWGFYDLYGNIAEWVLDWHDGISLVGKPSVDPTGAASAATPMRGVRGDYFKAGGFARSAQMDRVSPNVVTGGDVYGFRLCAPAAASAK